MCNGQKCKENAICVNGKCKCKYGYHGDGNVRCESKFVVVYYTNRQRKDTNLIVYISLWYFFLHLPILYAIVNYEHLFVHILVCCNVVGIKLYFDSLWKLHANFPVQNIENLKMSLESLHSW